MKHDHDKGVEIHARVLISRFGKMASDDAENHAKKLKMSGDKEGYKVWMKVAERIKSINSSDKSKNK